MTHHPLPKTLKFIAQVQSLRLSAVIASPRLTADDLAAGRGLQFIPGVIDNAAMNKDKLRGIRKMALEHFGHQKGNKNNYIIIVTFS